MTGNLRSVHVLLTSRRAVDLCRVGSSLCRG
ncbi:putative leader peptide [Actinopolyspora erythraea]